MLALGLYAWIRSFVYFANLVCSQSPLVFFNPSKQFVRSDFICDDHDFIRTVCWIKTIQTGQCASTFPLLASFGNLCVLWQPYIVDFVSTKQPDLLSKPFAIRNHQLFPTFLITPYGHDSGLSFSNKGFSSQLTQVIIPLEKTNFLLEAGNPLNVILLWTIGNHMPCTCICTCPYYNGFIPSIN